MKTYITCICYNLQDFTVTRPGSTPPLTVSQLGQAPAPVTMNGLKQYIHFSVQTL